MASVESENRFSNRISDSASGRPSSRHGGDWKSFEERYGREPLDFSASVSPLGMSRAAKRAASLSLQHASRYPDPDSRALTAKLAQSYGLKKEWILCAGGAGDLIERLAHALRPGLALLLAPTYAEYRKALVRNGWRIREYRLSKEQGFRIQEDILDQIEEGLELILLCEPNNPTGLTTKPDLLIRIADRCREKNVLLVLDECFNDFLESPQSHTLLGKLSRYPLLILRGFTKFYGMAGLRLGWCASSDEELLGRMREAGQPWPVSLPAQAAGEEALRDKAYEKRLRCMIRTQREKLMRELISCGCEVIPGEANYLLFYDRTPMLDELLARRGILIRDCRDFSGLGNGWYRTAVRRRWENRRLIRAVREVHRWETS